MLLDQSIDVIEQSCISLVQEAAVMIEQEQKLKSFVHIRGIRVKGHLSSSHHSTEKCILVCQVLSTYAVFLHRYVLIHRDTEDMQ